MMKYTSFYDEVFTCLHNSSLRLIRHFFLIPLRWRIRQILLITGIYWRMFYISQDMTHFHFFDSLWSVVWLHQHFSWFPSVRQFRALATRPWWPAPVRSAILNCQCWWLLLEFECAINVYYQDFQITMLLPVNYADKWNFAEITFGFCNNRKEQSVSSRPGILCAMPKAVSFRVLSQKPARVLTVWNSIRAMSL